LSDLENLAAWVAREGGQIVATLPLLTTFFDDASTPAPYLPLSRLFWNEFYLDINKIPELKECPSAQALVASSSFQDEIEALRRSRLVDYTRQMALKRKILEELSRCLFAGESVRLDELQRRTLSSMTMPVSGRRWKSRVPPGNHGRSQSIMVP
jgi:4-alpha-glucanotransferase